MNKLFKAALAAELVFIAFGTIDIYVQDFKTTLSTVTSAFVSEGEIKDLLENSKPDLALRKLKRFHLFFEIGNDKIEELIEKIEPDE